MSDKRKLQIPDEQLALIYVEPAPLKKQKKHKVKRIASLEERVTRLEAEVTLVGGQLDREEYIDEDDD